MEHPQLIESAFVAYLTVFQTGMPAASPWPAGMGIFPGENNLDKLGQRIVCYVEDGELGEEEPPNSGNRWAEPIVELRTPFNLPVGTATSPLVSHQAVSDALQSAILSNTLPDQLNTAQPLFTVFGLTDRKPMREQGENYWLSAWRVRLLSCASAIPA